MEEKEFKPPSEEGTEWLDTGLKGKLTSYSTLYTFQTVLCLYSKKNE